MRRPLALALACATPACQGAVTLVDEALRSVLLVELRDGSPTVSAHALGRVERELTPGAELYALGYAAELSALELEPGPVALGTPGSPLPPADRYDRLDGEAWTALDARPSVLEGVRLAYLDRCARFRLEVEELPRDMGEFTRFALPLDDARVLVGSSFGRLYVVTASTVAPYVDANLPYLGGARRGDELWLVGPGSQVQRGHPDRGFVDAPPLPFGVYGQAVVAASPPSAPLELFVTDDTLAVAYFDGERWSLIRQPTPIDVTYRRASLAWAEPGVAVLAGMSDAQVLDLDKVGFERPTMLDLPHRPSDEAIINLTHVEGIGVVAASRYTVTFVRDPSGWRRLPFAEVTPTADEVIDLGGSFLVGGQGGVYVEYRADGTVCPELTGLGFEFTHAAARLGSGFVLVSPRDAARYALVRAFRAR